MWRRDEGMHMHAGESKEELTSRRGESKQAAPDGTTPLEGYRLLGESSQTGR
jgi:hypothetical protein